MSTGALIVLGSFLCSFLIGYYRARWGFVLLIPLGWTALGLYGFVSEWSGVGLVTLLFWAGVGMIALICALIGKGAHSTEDRIKQRLRR
jgi:hypothetical protein